MGTEEREENVGTCVEVPTENDEKIREERERARFHLFAAEKMILAAETEMSLAFGQTFKHDRKTAWKIPVNQRPLVAEIAALREELAR